MCVRNVASLAKDFWQTSQKNSCAALGRRRPPGDIPGAGECSAGADLNRVGATRALRAALGAAGSRQPTATQLQSAPSQNRTQQWVKMYTYGCARAITRAETFSASTPLFSISATPPSLYGLFI
jgi:hypothetical protein